MRRLQVSEIDRALAWLDGDPLRENWHDFRPLKISREESWSDWLAHLLLRADKEFLQQLFTIPALPGAAPYVRREQELLIDRADRSMGNYRPDILVEWTEPMLGLHLEVKVGDPHLEKTWGEAQHLRDTHGGEWRHFLLVLPKQKAEAERLKKRMEPPNGLWPTVAVLTWEDVEREIRYALLRPATSRSWRSLARTFAGALGQLQLGRPVLTSNKGEADGI